MHLSTKSPLATASHQHLGNLLLSSEAHQIRVTSVLDAHHSHAVKLPCSGPEVDVGPVVMVDRGLRAIER